MDKFGFVKLKDVCNINMGQSPDSDSYNDNEDGIPFFQGNADFGEKYPTTRKWCNAPTKIAHAEDILISVRAPIGALNYAKEECCIGRGLAAITPNQDKVSSGFIYWLLKGKHKELNLQGTGSTFKAISRKVLEEIKVPDIELKKQTELAGSLEKIYSVIQLRKQQLEELDILIKARFVEMFGDPIQNEKNWSRRSLEQLCHSIVDCPHSTPNYISEDTGFMCIRTSVVKKNKILWDEIEYIVEDEFNQRIQRKRPEKGDIVYTREGAILGIAAIIDRNCNVALGQRSMLLSPDSSVCTSEFICTAMNSDSFLSNALRGISGSASPHINVGDIKSFEMIAPPLELQRKFSEFNSQVDKLKVEVQSIFLNCDSRSIFRYAQSIKGCKIEKYERRCSFDTKRECHRGNEKKWWICYLSAIKSDC